MFDLKIYEEKMEKALDVLKENILDLEQEEHPFLC